MRQYAGSKDFVEQTDQPNRRRFRSGSGWTTVRVWKGATDQWETFYNSGKLTFAVDIDVEVNSDGWTTVTAEFGITGGSGDPVVADPISRTWTLTGNDIEVSPFSLPAVQTALSHIVSIEERARLIANVDALVRGDREFTDIGGNEQVLSVEAILTNISNAITDDDLATLRMLISAMASGIEGIPTSQYVLKKVETVQALSQLTVAHANVNRMHRWQALLNAEPTLPSAILIDSTGIGANINYWLKRTPSTEQVNRGQWQLTQEWWGFYNYDFLVYKDAITS